METKNTDDIVFRVFQWMGYGNHFTVPPIGLSGGLALFWKCDAQFEILSSCANFIDTRVKYKSKEFYLTFVYGHTSCGKRKEIWDNLSQLNSCTNGAWLLTVDFNDIVDHSEKKGGPPHWEGSFVNIITFYSQNGLWDLKHAGNPLSWRGMRYDHFVRVRLDRTISNDDWFEDYPSSRAEFLRFEGSNHRPLITFIDDSRVK